MSQQDANKLIARFVTLTKRVHRYNEDVQVAQQPKAPKHLRQNLPLFRSRLAEAKRDLIEAKQALIENGIEITSIQ